MAKRNKKVSVSNTTTEGNEMAIATAPKNAKTDKSKDHGFKILEVIEISPADIVFNDALRGRVQPVTDDIVVDRADSLRRNGQLQPIQIRKNAEGKFEPVFGNTRVLAGLKLLNGYTNGEGKEVRPDAGFKLRAEVVEVDDETAFLRNVVENAQRTQTSPIDNAVNQQRLRDQFGMSDAMITKHYGYASQASVSRLKKLLNLEEDFQRECHNGTLTQGAAFLLADVEGKENRDAVWLKAVDKSKGEDGISAQNMAMAIKEWRKETREKNQSGNGDANQPTAPVDGTTGTETAPTEGTATEPAGPGRPKGTSTALTLKAFKDMCKEIGADPACPAVVEQAMGMILSTIEGKTDGPAFAQWFADNLIGGDIPPAVQTAEGGSQLSAEDSFDPAKNPRMDDEGK